MKENYSYRGSKEAFGNAMSQSYLSSNPTAPNFAGRFMYMYSNNDRDYFKNIETRLYINVPS